MVWRKKKKRTGLDGFWDGWVRVRGSKSQANVTMQCRVPPLLLCQNHEELIQSKEMLIEADHHSTDAYLERHSLKPDLVIMDKRESIRPSPSHLANQRCA